MTKAQKKGKSGTAVEYITRTRAVRKLQLQLADFRRLCILKGIYPRDPKHKNKVKGGATNKSAIYLAKDIQFLSHEPLLQKFRDLKAFHKRLRKYVGKGEWAKAKSVEKNMKPEISLDHLVRERYPSFSDALRDLDDPLSMLALFATLPRTDVESHQADTSRKCARLMREFEAYVVATGTLRKTFISIKGIYYQAEVLGQTVTWVAPHEFATRIPTDVDFKVMLTFLEFYMTLMRFVNFRLFKRLGWEYPQTFIEDGQEVVRREVFPAVAAEAAELFPNRGDLLLHGCKVFISREVPCRPLSFVLQCLGAEVSFASNNGAAPIAEDDTSLTHQIVDRPALNRMYVDRHYVQPQWVFDALNANQLLDMNAYRIGATLPPHLSPFVTEDDDEEALSEGEEEEEKEKEKEQKGDRKQQAKAKGEQDEDASDPAGQKGKKGEKEKGQTKAQKELAVSLLSKKRKYLYEKMRESRKKKTSEKKRLEAKRAAIQSAQNK